MSWQVGRSNLAFTATEYRWSNPRMAKGNFIEANLDADGVLEITVKL